MEQEILNSYSKLNSLNVSRETYLDFELFISMIIEKNKEINLISQETAKNEAIRERHIIDSAQIIDFVDLNGNTTCDLGTGGGMPGLIVAIAMKKIKNTMKINQVLKILKKSKVDIQFVSAPENIAWLLNLRGNDSEYSPIPNGYLIIEKNNVILKSKAQS